MIPEVNRRNILKLAWPLILASASDVIMTTVDAAFVGHLGTTQIAAVGLSGIFIWATYNLFKGVCICVGTMVSQNYGAKKYHNSIAALYNGLIVAAVAAFLLYLYRYSIPTLFSLMKPSLAVQETGVVYTQIRLLGAIGFLSSISFASFFRGVSKTKIILIVSVVANALNIILDYLFIFRFSYGVAGAATATVISQITASLIYLSVFIFLSIDNFSLNIKKPIFNFTEMRKLLQIGVPFSLRIFSEVFVFFLFTMLVGRLGDAQLAATTIMIQILTFTNMTALGFGQAGEVVMGQHIGAGNHAMAKKGGFLSMELNTIFTVAFAFILFIFPEEICSIFNKDVAVITFFKAIIVFGMVEICFDGLQMVLAGCLSGAGDTKIQFYYMIGLGYLFFLPLVYLMTFVLELGVVGAWMSSAIFIVIFASVLFFRFRSDAWKKIVLVENN